MACIDLISKIFSLIAIPMNLYIAYLVYQLQKKEHNPQLVLNLKMEPKEDNNYFVDDILFDMDLYIFNIINFKEDGFPNIKHEKHIWYLDLENHASFPATDVEISISLIIKIINSNISLDRTEVFSSEIVEYKEIKKSIKVKYFSGHEKKRIPIVSLYGDFIEADLIISKLDCNEMKFIKKKILIGRYEHFGKNKINDAKDLLDLIGVTKDKNRNE